jgi:hypothetical protein
LAPLVSLSACGGTTEATSATLSAAVAKPTAASVAVSPQPGTPDASPSTQISFLGGAGTQVSDVHVVGSHSGSHSGVLRAYSTGTGESFLPSHPFSAGEKVTVHAEAGGAAVSTSFTIAHQAPVSQKEFPLNPGDSKAVQHYSTAPSLTPSTIRITTPAKPGGAAGDLFLAPYQGKGTPGPTIAEQNGSLVWFKPLPAGESSTNFQVQQYQGKPVLTWWQGRILEVGFGQGEDEIYNTSYQHVATVKAGNGYHADLHEIHLRRQIRRRADRLGRPGDRHQDRPGDVGVARARTHLARGIEQPRAEIQLSVGLRAHQLDQSRDERRRAALLAQHVDAVRRQHRRRGSALADRRQALELQAGRRHALLLAARRGVAARRLDLGVRQRLGPAEGEAVARAADQP